MSRWAIDSIAQAEAQRVQPVLCLAAPQSFSAQTGRLCGDSSSKLFNNQFGKLFNNQFDKLFGNQFGNQFGDRSGSSTNRGNGC